MGALKIWGIGAVVVATGITVYAAGSKKTAEACVEDGECSRGYCHTKQDRSKVCIDCSSSEISNFRGQIQRFCKEEPRTCKDIPRTVEVHEDYFKVRLENADRCIKARDGENRSCWNGGDDEHKQALDEAERSRKNCYDEWNTRRGNGGLSTCSESTYTTLARNTDTSCAGYGRGCDAWSKDDRVVSCGDIEDAMKKTSACVEAVEKLDNDCLPQLSDRRQAQFRDGKKAYDSCKEVLDYKKDKKLCR